MRPYLIAAAALLIAGPAWAADPLTTTGFINSVQNQANQRIDAFQAANHNVIPAPLNAQIDATQGQINTSITQIKSLNPAPNAVSPIQTFVIPPFPTIPH